MKHLGNLFALDTPLKCFGALAFTLGALICLLIVVFPLKPRSGWSDISYAEAQSAAYPVKEGRGARGEKRYYRWVDVPDAE